MRDKKIFILVTLITTVMLFVGGCGKQTEPVSAEPTETIKEVGTEESLEPTPSSPVEQEESMESSEVEDNSENEVIVDDEVVDEDESVIEDEVVEDEAEPVKTEAPKTDTGGSKTNGSTNSGTSGGSKTEDVKPANPTPAPTPTPTPAHTHNWKEHTVTEQVWVPNIVVVDDYEYRVVGRTDDVAICNNCGYTTTSRDDIVSHIEKHIIAGEKTQFTIQPGYDIIEQVKVGSHEEDRGHNETKTYVDYYYCDCGETKK